MDSQTDISILTQNDNEIEYTGGTFGTFPVKNWRFAFSGGKLWQVIVTYPYLVVKNNEGWPLDKQFAKLSELAYRKVRQRAIFALEDFRHHNLDDPSNSSCAAPGSPARRVEVTTYPRYCGFFVVPSKRVVDLYNSNCPPCATGAVLSRIAVTSFCVNGLKFCAVVIA